MSDPYERAKGGRLSFKGGALATRGKSIDKKNKKKKHKKPAEDHGGDPDNPAAAPDGEVDVDASGGGDGQGIYTIDAAKKMKYEELFPVETKKFGYDPKLKAQSVEDALDDRVKKKADRYCK
ncbi:uncharacterized protein LOC116212743 [Punica granatum]|uniref:Uncharacterized protein LOC116212743 n=2 Tax=Punica granatum TaxID=22663 RepID=A0A6P8E9R6_PUNGR|nr:uncharacterized protein LOC116212743 [Punica granatum]PKI53482.1 hypothetical protein CRG98_026172 [Punica granatum]